MVCILTRHCLLLLLFTKKVIEKILSDTVDDSEDESCWENCFESLKARGLTGVKLVISDGHKGIKVAVRKAFL